MRKRVGGRLCGSRLFKPSDDGHLYCKNMVGPGRKRCKWHNFGHPHPPDSARAWGRRRSAQYKLKWQDPAYREVMLAARKRSALYKATHGGRGGGSGGRRPYGNYDRITRNALLKVAELMAQNQADRANVPAKWSKQSEGQKLLTLTGRSLEVLKELLEYNITPEQALESPAHMKLLSMRRDTAYGMLNIQVRVGDQSLRQQEIDRDKEFIDALDETRARMAKAVVTAPPR